MIQFILVFVFVLSDGFLLLTNTPLNYGTQAAGNQYITKLELYDTKNQLQNELNYLRNDMNTKFDLLTSQLQQMLASFQQQIAGQGSNKAIESVELKYNEVLGNYTKLQKEFDSLQIKYSKQEIELQSVKNKTKNLEDDSNKQEIELKLVKNETKDLMYDIRFLQQEVQSISMQTHYLTENEQARIQDFQALYNNLMEHEVNESGIIQSLNSSLYQKLQISEITNYATLSNVTNKMEELKKSLNVSFLGIHQQIAKNSERVALTACAEVSEFGPQPSGYIIKYRDIRTQVNVNNLYSFRNSGKFTCEREGLYLVSASDLSKKAGSMFSIYKNGNLIANAFISGSDNYYYRTTAIVAVELLPNDSVWVQVRNEMYVYEDQTSCLTIMKVK